MRRSFLRRSTSSSPTHTSSASPLAFLLNQCTHLNHVHATHGYLLTRGLDRDNFFLAHFLDTCFYLGFSDHASTILAHKADPDLYLYNSAIRALSENGSSSASAREALRFYDGIQAAGLRSDSYSLPFALRAVIRLSAIGVGKQIHCQSVRMGFASEVHVATALVRLYWSCGCGNDAHKVFEEMSCGHVALWNAMIAGYAKFGDMDSAAELFDRMPERDLISWTTVIGGCAQWSRPNEAIRVFKRMLIEEVEPDEVSMLAGLSACSQLGALALGEWIHCYITKHGLKRTVPLDNALIDMYAKSGSIGKALQVFKNMKEKSLVTWTTVIAGLALHGRGTQALKMFSQMERAKVRPNEVTFTAILSACSHAGLVKIGFGFFNIMSSRYGIDPKIEQYGCMIDLLGRSGYLREAEELVRSMPFEANAAIRGSLLAASNSYGDPDLGERMLRHLMKLEPENSGNFLLMSNTYAGLSRWNESRSIRKAMREIGTEKLPGRSSIELNGEAHEFTAHDWSHNMGDVIFEVLNTVNEQLKIDSRLYSEFDGVNV